MSSSASNSSFIEPTAASMRDTKRLCSAGLELVPQLGDEQVQGMQRLAQVVARGGQKVRLVLVGDFKLAALVLDLREQSRILDRKHRLSS